MDPVLGSNWWRSRALLAPLAWRTTFLGGRILAVCVVRGKPMNALQAGFTDVIIPAGNASLLEELPAEVKEALRIQPVEHVKEAFGLLGLG